MKRRDLEIRVTVHKWIDGMVFALGFWLAHFIRFNWYNVPDLLRKFAPLKGLAHYVRYDLAGLPMKARYQPDNIGPFDDYFKLFLVVIILGKFALESQGYYQGA